jgi:vacuolar-type H+-ATPase subunit I/STV1
MFALWWRYGYGPKEAALEQVRTEAERLSLQERLLEKKIQKLSELQKEKEALRAQAADLSDRFLSGATAEEVNGSLRSMVQQVLDRRDVRVTRYNELPAGKWREQSLALQEYSLEMGMDELAELLRFVESMAESVRVETLRVHYRPRSEDPLIVTMRLGALVSPFGKEAHSTEATVGDDGKNDS